VIDPERLVAAYLRFARAVAQIPDAKAQELHQVASRIPEFVGGARERRPELTPAQIAQGLAQGLQELPDLIREVEDPWRAPVARAFHEALEAECPQWLAQEAWKLQTILQRGRIESQAELQRVMHRIDVLESEPELAAELQRLYALAGAYRPA
jgi:hypothetical protein